MTAEFEILDKYVSERVAALNDSFYLLTAKTNKIEHRVFEEEKPILQLVEKALTLSKDHLHRQLFL